MRVGGEGDEEKQRRITIAHYQPFSCSLHSALATLAATLSGIVTLLFTAMFSNRYVTPNLSERTKEDSESFFRLIAHISETSIFLILGLSVLKTFKTAEAHFAFLFWTCVACVVARAFNVYR